MPTTPPELIYHILDHLHDDKHTLFACAVVSRHWLSVARSHLFSFLVVDNGVVGRDISSLLQFLADSPGPSVCQYVKTLRIERGECSLSDVLLILPKLPQLLNLIMLATTIRPTVYGADATCLSLSTPLRSLDIASCTVVDEGQSWRTIFELITAFPSIHDLDLDNLQISRTMIGTSSPPDVSVLLGRRKTRVVSLSYSPQAILDSDVLADLTVQLLDLRNITRMFLQAQPWWRAETQHYAQTLQNLLELTAELRQLRVGLFGHTGRECITDIIYP